MEEGPKKLFLKIYKKKFTKEKISADIVCNLCIADFQKIGTTDLMLLRLPGLHFQNMDHAFLEKTVVPISLLFQRCYWKM